MDFYQQLQLSSIGSKQWIKGAKDSKEKYKRILIYNFKVYLVVAFCFALVTLYSMIFGSQNSVVGVLVLLVLMILRQVDFGIDTKHSIGVIFMIFAILAVGPRLANTVNTVPAFFIHFLCIMAIMILSCHNVIMSNQSTFILGYLLFYGYDVTGHNYVLRCCGLFAGAVICSLVFYKNHRNRTFHRGFYHLFKEFHLFSARSSWYLRLSLGISTAMLIGELVHMPRVMWIGIAAMSVLLPFSKDMKYRVQRRGPFNILGCMIFLILHAILPDHIFQWIGLIGGIGVGYSAGYAWQTVFNTFGALYIAENLFGLKNAIILRIAANVFGSLYAYEVKRQLEAEDLSVLVDDRNEKIGRKIRDTELKRIPYMLIVGEKEAENNEVSVRKQGEGDKGSMKIATFAALLKGEIEEQMNHWKKDNN